MPYAEALSLTRNAQQNTIANRRAAKSPTERYHDHGYFPPAAINISSYPYSGPSSAGVPFSAPPHFPTTSLFPQHYASEQAAFSQDSTRRPSFKHVQTAPPGGMYTMHHPTVDRSPGQQFRSPAQEGYPGQWQAAPGPPHYAGTSTETFHQNQELADPSNSFWRLGGGNITSPTPTEISLPPPRPQSQWVPTLGNNYTHERPASSNVTLPAPNNSQLGETSPFVATAQPQYYPPSINTSVGHPMSFATSTTQTSGSSQSHDEHCETNGHWSRPTSGYRSGGSI
jgi:hypothetical protein